MQTEITNERKHISKQIEFDSYWFEKLRSLVSLNTSAKIKIDYNLASCFEHTFNFDIISVQELIQINVKKNGEILILSNTSILTPEHIADLIKQNDKYSSLEKGKYPITVNTEESKGVFINYISYSNPEKMPFEIRLQFISNIAKL